VRETAAICASSDSPKNVAIADGSRPFLASQRRKRDDFCRFSSLEPELV
jgi:hypothetical protein